ncbi:MAG TPA: PDZ domain-containing protein [Thermoanaerobaculia bacterium]|nr:PDZ domain-containing protein [Thermoanaerobaculia bacterium]
MRPSPPSRALRLLASLAALLLLGLPALGQEDDASHRIEIRKIAKSCEGEECEEERHVVIHLDEEGLDLSSIPGISELELLGDEGHNVFFFGGGGGSYLGVQLVGLTDALRRHFGVPEGQGVMVSEVGDDTPAWRAGIQAGDVITAAGGEPVSSSSGLSQIIRSTEPGASIDFEVWRDGVPITISAQVDEREPRNRARAFFLDCDDDDADCSRVTVRGLDVGCDGGECGVVVRCDDGDCTCTVNGEDRDCESLESFQWRDRRRHFQQQQ